MGLLSSFFPTLASFGGPPPIVVPLGVFHDTLSRINLRRHEKGSSATLLPSPFFLVFFSLALFAKFVPLL